MQTKENGLLVKRLRRRPLTAETGVRFPYKLRKGSEKCILICWQPNPKEVLEAYNKLSVLFLCSDPEFLEVVRLTMLKALIIIENRIRIILISMERSGYIDKICKRNWGDCTVIRRAYDSGTDLHADEKEKFWNCTGQCLQQPETADRIGEA